MNLIINKISARDMIELFLKKGANVNHAIRGRYGEIRTALSCLMEEELFYRCEHESDNDHLNAIEDSTLKNIADITSLLLKSGADLTLGQVYDSFKKNILNIDIIDVAYILNNSPYFPKFETVCDEYKKHLTYCELRKLPELNALPPGLLPISIAYVFGHA